MPIMPVAQPTTVPSTARVTSLRAEISLLLGSADVEQWVQAGQLAVLIRLNSILFVSDIHPTNFRGSYSAYHQHTSSTRSQAVARVADCTTASQQTV